MEAIHHRKQISGARDASQASKGAAMEVAPLTKRCSVCMLQQSRFSTFSARIQLTIAATALATSLLWVIAVTVFPPGIASHTRAALSILQDLDINRWRHGVPCTSVAAQLTGTRRASCVVSYVLHVPTSGNLIHTDRYLMALETRHHELLRNFPGWEMRVYLDGAFTQALADQIAAVGANVLRIQPFNSSHPTWYRSSQRMLVMDDPDVDVFMLRDLDSALLARDSLAVHTWLTTGVGFLTLHDHFWHGIPIMAGMWGGRRQAVKALFPSPVGALLDKTLKSGQNGEGNDQKMLDTVVWPLIKSATLAFDALQSSCRYTSELCHPMPAQPQLTPLFLGDVVGPQEAVEELRDPDCADFAGKLSQIRVLVDDNLNKLWKEQAEAHMLQICSKP
jgi:hypothetical protein